MVIKVKFKAISYRGVPVNFVEKIEVPDFKDFHYKWKAASGKEFSLVEKVKAQQDSYLHDLDKQYLIIKHDLSGIIDWQIMEKKPRVPSEKIRIDWFVANIFKGEFKEQLQLDFIATFAHMKKSLKGLSTEKKIDVVLEAMSVGYTAVTTSIKNINDTVEERMQVWRDTQHPSIKAQEERIAQWVKDKKYLSTNQD